MKKNYIVPGIRCSAATVEVDMLSGSNRNMLLQSNNTPRWAGSKGRFDGGSSSFWSSNNRFNDEW